MTKFRVDLIEYRTPDRVLVTHHHNIYSDASDDFEALMKNDTFIDNINVSSPYQLILTEINDMGIITVHRRELLIP